MTLDQMPALTGYFATIGLPAVKIVVFGAYPHLAQEFEAILDTGFTGFLSMPVEKAAPLGLVLAGTEQTRLANGSENKTLTVVGMVRLGKQELAGPIHLIAGAELVLLGMEALRAFNKVLVVSRFLVALVDEHEALPIHRV
jgi:predicted aspartyl protease